MKPKFSDLWRWDGEVDRGAYALWGAVLIAVKYNLDRFVLKQWFGADFSILDYFRPTGPAALHSVKGLIEQQLTFRTAAPAAGCAARMMQLRRGPRVVPATTRFKSWKPC